MTPSGDSAEMSPDNDIWAHLAGLTELQMKMAQRLDGLEEMAARLMVGLTELWAGVEAVIDVVLDTKSPDEQGKFRAGLKTYTTELWKAVHAQSQNMARNATNTAATMGDVAPDKPPVRTDI